MIQQVQAQNAGKQVHRKTSASQALRETDGGQKAGGRKDERREKEVGVGGAGKRETGKATHRRMHYTMPQDNKSNMGTI